ncbi:hypothetical protein GCM10029963_55240 [Micromonospora andamanensis]
MTPGGSQSPPGVVVVTGVSRYLGAHVAARLAADPRIDRVIGIDLPEPGPEVDALLDRVERIRVDAGSVGVSSPTSTWTPWYIWPWSAPRIRNRVAGRR